MSNWKNRIVRTGEQPAGEFLANPGNWRVHPKNQRDALRGVLGEVGWVTGVIVNRTTGHMLDGHARVEEALKLGDETPVPFIEVELTEAEEKTVLATFDPISAMAAADKEQLDALLRDVSTASEGVQSMLTELAEKNGLEYGSQIGGTLEDAEPQIDKAAELARKWGTARGQVWRLGEHRLMCGDSTSAEDVARLMQGERADAVVTDPPYGIGVDKSMHEKSGQKYGKAAAPKRHYANTNWDVRPDKSVIDGLVSMAPSVIIWGGNYFELPPARCVLVWDKENGGNQFADCELAWTNLDKPVRLIRHMWNGMIRADKEERTAYPTQKPLAVIVWAIQQCGDTAGIVYEPFSGSGTTIMACEQLGRKCRAMEIAPEYVAVALERWATATGGTPELLNEPNT